MRKADVGAGDQKTARVGEARRARAISIALPLLTKLRASPRRACRHARAGLPRHMAALVADAMA